MPKTSSSPSDINVTDLIETICGFRKETYPYERQIALLTFAAWTLFPNRLEVMNQARVVAAASVIQSIRRTRFPKAQKNKIEQMIDQIGRHSMEFESVAEILLNPPLIGDFKGEGEATWGNLDASSIVAFLLRSPVELRPSINKAIFFIDAGGFGKDAKASQATLKKNWTQYAISSPFTLAGEYLESPIPFLMPDDPNAISMATRIVKNIKTVRKYFGCTKYFQEILLTRLDPSSLKRFSFVKFPTKLKPHRVKIEPLELDQIELVKKYKAPKDIDANINLTPTRLEMK